MSNLMPVKLKPTFKDYLWGGTRLKEEFGSDTHVGIHMEPMKQRNLNTSDWISLAEPVCEDLYIMRIVEVCTEK